MNQGIIDTGRVTYKYFYYAPAIFFFQYHLYSGQSKLIRNLSFTLLGLPLKQLNLTM